MESLLIEATENSPRILLDPEKLVFEFSGESRPEDVRKFFKPVISWLDRFNSWIYWQQEKRGKEAEKKKIEVLFTLEYFNSSSAKFLMDIINKFNEIKNNCSGVSIAVKWYYDAPDEDMLEAGHELEKLSKLDFEFHTIASKQI